MRRLRIVVLAPFCDPDAVSMPYVTYSHAASLGKIHDVDLVIGAPVEGNVKRAQGPFRIIEVVRMPLLERLYALGTAICLQIQFHQPGIDGLRVSLFPCL